MEVKIIVKINTKNKTMTWSCECPYLNIHVNGDSYIKVLNQLKEEIDILYKEYVQEKDENLTLDAQKLKKDLQELEKFLKEI